MSLTCLGFLVRNSPLLHVRMLLPGVRRALVALPTSVHGDGMALPTDAPIHRLPGDERAPAWAHRP